MKYVHECRWFPANESLLPLEEAPDSTASPSFTTLPGSGSWGVIDTSHTCGIHQRWKGSHCHIVIWSLIPQNLRIKQVDDHCFCKRLIIMWSNSGTAVVRLRSGIPSGSFRILGSSGFMIPNLRAGMAWWELLVLGKSWPLLFIFFFWVDVVGPIRCICRTSMIIISFYTTHWVIVSIPRCFCSLLGYAHIGYHARFSSQS